MVVHGPGGIQAMVRFAEGSSTAAQPDRRPTIGIVNSTPLIVGVR
jgi:hypothetical protein